MITVVEEKNGDIKEAVGTFVRVADDANNANSNAINTGAVTTAGAGYLDDDIIKEIDIQPDSGNVSTHPGKASLDYSDGSVSAVTVDEKGFNYKDTSNVVIDLPKPSNKVEQATTGAGGGYTYDEIKDLNYYEVHATNPMEGDQPAIIELGWKNVSSNNAGYQLTSSREIFNGKYGAASPSFARAEFGNPGTYLNSVSINAAGSGYNLPGAVQLSVWTIAFLDGRLLPHPISVGLTWSGGSLTGVTQIGERLNTGIDAGTYTLDVSGGVSGTTAAKINFEIRNGGKAFITFDRIVGVAAKLTFTTTAQAIIPQLEYDVGGVITRIPVKVFGKRDGLLKALGTPLPSGKYGKLRVKEQF